MSSFFLETEDGRLWVGIAAHQRGIWPDGHPSCSAVWIRLTDSLLIGPLTGQKKHFLLFHLHSMPPIGPLISDVWAVRKTKFVIESQFRVEVGITT